MPARFAMSSVDVPSKPRSANSMRAASRIESLRSAAERRVLVELMRVRLVITHKLVKRLRDPVELALGEPLVERERQRPLEGGVRTGERPLVTVGAEPVQRVRADL